MPLIIPLCSSSSGNAVFIGRRNSGVLIDAGCSLKRLSESLVACGTSLEAVRAVFITHEHTDHVKGLFQLTKHYQNIPVYASPGTLRVLLADELVHTSKNLYEITQVEAAGFSVSPFHTPHDAAESLGYVLEDLENECKIAYCTDLGTVTGEVRAGMLGADIVFLESNYDPRMLQTGSYPYYIKRRVASDIGHLSNADSAQFLAELLSHGATRFILGHLSRENNTPDIVLNSAVSRLAEHGAALNRDYTLEIAPAVTKGRVVAV